MCASCRAEGPECGSCRLGKRIDAAANERFLSGSVGRSAPGPRRTAPPIAVDERPEARALAALGYPFWPIALIALFDPSRSAFVRRNAWQALGFNFGMYALLWLMTEIASIPFVGFSAWPLLPFIIPATVVGSVLFALKAWRGEDVRVPFVSDVVDSRLGR
jgi:uncharacterized membrane protein